MHIKHHHLQTVTSTQDSARALLASSAGAPFLITADAQTAGRGRLGRNWISSPGNFYGSLVIDALVLPARYGEYSFLSAVVLYQTLAAFSDNAITLKWPNDILSDGKKCAGILIEVVADKLIIGMGVNLLHAPPPDMVDYPAVALGIADYAGFTGSLLRNFSSWYLRYEQEGFDPIRTTWLEQAHALGQTITVKTPQQRHVGIFAGLDGDGSLLLTQGTQVIKVTSADVTLS